MTDRTTAQYLWLAVKAKVGGFWRAVLFLVLPGILLATGSALPIIKTWSLPVSQSTPPSNLWIVVIDGQSNGAGQGPLPPSGILLPTSHVDRLWTFTHGAQWWEAFDPMVSVSSTYGGTIYPVLDATPIGIGPGLFFAQKFADLTANVNIGVVNVGVGGSSIAQHLPSFDTGTIYGAGRALINAAKSKGKVKALLYVGGEREGQSLAAANALVANFTAIVNQYRNDHGRDLIVLFPQLGTNPNISAYPYWENAKAQQALVNIPGVYMIPTDDCEKQSDGIHYTNAGYQTLGERMAIKFREVLATLPGETF